MNSDYIMHLILIKVNFIVLQAFDTCMIVNYLRINALSLILAEAYESVIMKANFFPRGLNSGSEGKNSTN